MNFLEPGNYIDERNRNLWIELNRIFEFKLIESPEENYISRLNDGVAEIYVVKGDICKDSFTHELLHIYLKSKGIYIGGCFSNTIRDSSVLYRLFPIQLLEHISN